MIENPVNLRDLGGIAAADGRRVKPKRLLRSGELYRLTQQEKDVLLNEYHLKTVVDFRTEKERQDHPDDTMPGVRNVYIDIIADAENEAASYANFQKIRSETDVHAFMKVAYEAATMNQTAQRGYARFLRIALEQKEGALLFHCFAGKDRAGIGAALLLTLLGASREDIMADYMKTNEMRAAKNKEIADQLKQAGKTPQEIEIIYSLFFVKEEYLRHVFDMTKEKYGSFEKYIRETMGITDAEIAQLRENYLEAPGDR